MRRLLEAFTEPLKIRKDKGLRNVKVRQLYRKLMASEYLHCVRNCFIGEYEYSMLTFAGMSSTEQ